MFSDSMSSNKSIFVIIFGVLMLLILILVYIFIRYFRAKLEIDNIFKSKYKSLFNGIDTDNGNLIYLSVFFFVRR
jgi:hypothetical protein